jgi:hypothetical protein
MGTRASARRGSTLKTTLENPALATVDLILDEWILLEYSCCFLRVQLKGG